MTCLHSCTTLSVTSLFLSLPETRYVLDEWGEDYNHRRPHGALKWRTPGAYAASLAAPRVGAGAPPSGPASATAPPDSLMTTGTKSGTGQDDEAEWPKGLRGDGRCHDPLGEGAVPAHSEAQGLMLPLSGRPSPSPLGSLDSHLDTCFWRSIRGTTKGPAREERTMGADHGAMRKPFIIISQQLAQEAGRAQVGRIEGERR